MYCAVFYLSMALYGEGGSVEVGVISYVATTA
jgi:hypothetical protein